MCKELEGHNRLGTFLGNFSNSLKLLREKNQLAIPTNHSNNARGCVKELQKKNATMFA